MANTIKLKRGSGSDPQASDLEVGELAIRTDSGKIFTKKDNGSVAEISGGGGIDDGDKGDITVSNGGDTFTIDNGVVTGAKIADFTITNQDINASAAIAGSKISPSFTSDITVTNASPKLNLVDSGNNPDWEIHNDDGTFRITDTTNSSTKIRIDATSVLIPINLDANGGIDVSGSITVTGTVDGRDVATDGTKLDGIESNATADQSASEIVALIADQTIAPSAIDMEDNEEIRLGNSDDLKIFHNGSHSRFLDNGAGKLQFGSDTGFEILTANFATQIALFDTSQILLKENTSVTGNIAVTGTVDGVDIATRDTLFGGLTSSSGVLSNGVTATTQSASDNSTKVATTAYTDTAIANLVDSAPSTLDTLNELAAALGDDPNFATTVTNSIATKLPLAGGTLTGALNITNSATGLVLTRNSQTISLDANYGNGGDQAVLASASLRFYSNGTSERMRILANGNVGIANTSPSQKLDVTGNIAVSGTVDGRDVATDGSKLDGIESGATADQSASEIKTLLNSNQLEAAQLATNSVTEAKLATNSVTRNKISDGEVISSKLDSSAVTTSKINNDAVTFDKIENIATGGILGRNNSGTGSVERLTASEVRTLINVENGATADQSASEILTLLKTVDGAGSGLDADTLDGISSASFVRSDVDDTINGDLTIGANHDIRFTNGSWTGNSGTTPKIQAHSNYLYIVGGSAGIIFREDGTNRWIIDGSGHFDPAEDSTYDIGSNGVRVRNGYFDTLYGSGANLTNLPSQTDNNFTNADHSKLDGIAAGATNVTNTNQLTNGAGFLTSVNTSDIGNNAVDFNKIQVVATNRIIGRVSGGNGNIESLTPAQIRSLLGVENGATADQTASEILTLLKTVDGAGSGLDADTLDGVSSGSFARSDANDTLSGIITLSSTSQDCLNFSGNATNDRRGIAFNGRIALSADYNDGYLRLNDASEFSNGVYTPHRIRADSGYRVGGTEVINSSAQLIASRLTGALPAIDGSALTNISAGGATGGGSDEVFYENGQTVTTSYTITNGKNAMAAGPITINSGVTVTVGSGETLTIV